MKIIMGISHIPIKFRDFFGNWVIFRKKDKSKIDFPNKTEN